MENENKLIYIDDEGNEVLCEILFTFDSDKFNRSYVLFYPVGSEDEDDNVEVLAACYTPMEDGSVGELSEIETEEEWKLVEETLHSFSEEECECDEDCECDEECEEEDGQCCCHHHE